MRRANSNKRSPRPVGANHHVSRDPPLPGGARLPVQTAPRADDTGRLPHEVLERRPGEVPPTTQAGRDLPRPRSRISLDTMTRPLRCLHEQAHSQDAGRPLQGDDKRASRGAGSRLA